MGHVGQRKQVVPKGLFACLLLYNKNYIFIQHADFHQTTSIGVINVWKQMLFAANRLIHSFQSCIIVLHTTAFNKKVESNNLV